MSLDLAELVSVTDSVVRSLDKPGLNSCHDMDRIRTFHFDSPFESPKSSESAKENFSHATDSGFVTSSAAAKIKDNFKILPTCTEKNFFPEIHKDNFTDPLKFEQGKRYTLDQESTSSILDKSKDHGNINQQETTISDNNLRSSQSSKASSKTSKNDASLTNHHRDICINISTNKHFQEKRYVSDSDPEIIDIPERIIAIKSGLSSASEEDSTFNEIDTVVQANLPHIKNQQFSGIKSFGKMLNTQTGTLKQGALSKGILDPFETAQHGDVYISQYALTERQRCLKEALAKRADNSHPKKKVVQPKIISMQRQSEGDTDLDFVGSRQGQGQSGQPTNVDHTVTAAVAASAAVAATQPFLKAQQELEQRMQDFLKQLAELQAQNETPGKNKTSKSPKTSSRLEDLERQVAELNERRMEHMENLQQQQMQMQAQLLYMSRSRNHPRKPADYNSDPAANYQNQFQSAATSSILNSNPSTSTYFDTNNKPSTNFGKRSVQNGQSLFNPETLSSHFNYLNEVRELQGSHLDTPAPREKVPKPTPYSLPQPQPHSQKSLGFLEELLGQKEDPDKDTTFSVMGGYSPPTKLQRDSNNSARGRRTDKSPVDTARQLVTSLSELEKETADSVWISKNTGYKTSKHDTSPSPLERYLKHYDNEIKDTYEPSVPSSAAKRRARKHQAHLDQLGEAKEVLRQLEITRETLECNLESVLRSRRDVHVFSAMMAAAPEGTKEQLRIQRMVNKKISALEADVQREVLRGLAKERTQQLSLKRDQEQQKLKNKKGGPALTGTSTFNLLKKDYLPESKFSISAKQSEQSTRLAYGRQNMNMNANPGRHAVGKENRTSKVKPPPKPSVIHDEKTLARTYGRPEYQRGRTTIRDPYMHFQNAKRGVTSKTSLLNESAVSRDGRSRSPPKSSGRKEQGGNLSARQFFFSPTRGYIPLDQGDLAPIEGQLISMAIPLGEPRMDRGMRSGEAASLRLSPDRRKSNPVTSTPVPITSSGNVAVVSFPFAEEGSKSREPELSKQVLPPVDIDSISPSSSRRSDIQIRSPQHDNVNLTFLQNTREEVDEEDDHDYSDDTFTEGDPDLEQSGQGLVFPGYEPRPQAEYSGPSFPPQQAKAGGGDGMAGGIQAAPCQSQLSDVMAEDLRRRDELERNAVYWLEQELMAQVLSKVMPLEVDTKPSDITKGPAFPDDINDSKASSRDESLMVADMIGQGGLQLFIDAGQPVDNALIQALVKEVLQEKVEAMLAEGQTENQTQQQMEQVLDNEETAAVGKKLPEDQQRVPTPQPTPKTSPLVSPRRQKSDILINRPVTPPLSPPVEGFKFKRTVEQPQELPTQPPPIPPRRFESEEAILQPQQQPEPQMQQQQQQGVLQQQLQFGDAEDSEPSISIDISEELRRVAGQGKPVEQEETVVSRHSVATPPLSPPPVAPVTQQVTPPPTPSLVEASSPLKPIASPPKSAIRQEAPEEAEEEEEEADQPQAIMVSVGVGEDHPLSAGVQTTPRRTPSPKRPHTPVSVATEPSPPPSTESSLSETVNENVSEGQWLLSRSEGQVVAGLHINEAVRQQILKKGAMNRGGDISTASTLKDTDEIDLDDADPANKSEGEFLYNTGLPEPDQDPMLQLLAEMQRNPSLMVPQRDIPAPHVRQILSGPAPQDVRASTGRSFGELSMGQVPHTRMMQVQAMDDRESAQHLRQGPKANKGQRRSSSKSPAQSPNRSMEAGLQDNHRRERKDREEGRRRGSSSRTPSPLHDQQRPERAGHGSSHRNQTPPPALSQQQLLSSGSTRGRSSRGQLQYQPVLSEGAPFPTRGRIGSSYRGGGRRSSDSRISRSSDRAMQRTNGSSYASESVSRSADSISWRRSGENNTGVLTSSFKSRQSSTGAKKSVDFDLTGTHEGRQWQDDQDRDIQVRSSGGSRDRQSPSRLSTSSDPNRSRSLGITYSFDESLDDSELKKIIGSTRETDTGTHKMFVTIPSTAGDEGESELSEIDVSDRHYH